MIPARLLVARRIEALLHELAPDARGDADFVELLLPHFVAAILPVIGYPRLSVLLEEARKAKTSADAANPVRCLRYLSCGRNAWKERLDPRGSGKWEPVCEEHARGALPLELRPLTVPA